VCCTPAEPFASVALQTALGMNPDQITAEIPDIYEDHYRGRYSTEEFWKKVIVHFGLTETLDINPTALSAAYLDSYTLHQEVLDVAKAMGKNYQVALLSNLSPVMRDHIQQVHHTGGYFNPEIYSCDEGVNAIKPGKEIFNTLLEKAGSNAGECLFIDDTQKNIDAATELGFQTLLFITPEQFLQDITPLVQR
jgi:putative hydrolase of the HAD superfamily